MARHRTSRRSWTRLAIAIGAVLMCTGCSLLVPEPPAAEGGGAPDATLPVGWPAPALPVPDELRPLPALAGPEGGLAPRVGRLAEDARRVELAVLVIAATEDDPALGAWLATLDQAGTPHEVLIATEASLTTDRLVRADGTGRFSAVVLATGSLVYQADDGTWPSAFSDAEWALLFQYERDYAVRQLVLYAHPGLLELDASGQPLPTYPEDYGIRARDWGTGIPTTARLTPAGVEVFPDLDPDARIPVRDTWTYASYLLPGSTAVPLLVDDAGDVLAAIHVAPDGRERLVATFDQAWYLLHSQLVGHPLLRWVTQGTFIGERRLHFAADVDDWFVPTDLWIVGDDGSAPFTWDDFWRRVRTDGFELSAQDAWSFALQQNWLRAQYPQAGDFTWTMAFNGIGAEPSATSSCDPTEASLSAMTKCVAQDYRWVNHTWSHAYMDRNPPAYDISYDEIRAEIDQNDGIVDAFGFGVRYAARSLVTGDISGLGWHAPDGPDTGPKVDFGLEASNPDLLRAVVDTGRRYLASNMSTPSHEPVCAHCGIVHPLNDGVFLVPRWPTNVYAAVATPEAVVQSYNMVYAPGGIAPYYDAPLSYDQFLDVETGMALYHVLTGTPYPHYFHVANLYEYAPGRSLLTDFADALFDKVDDYLALPLISRSWDATGAYVEQRTEHANAGALGVWDRAAGEISLGAARGGTVFFTGGRLPGGEYVEYGQDFISWRSFGAGETVSVAAPVVPLPQTIDVADLRDRTTDEPPFDVTASTTSGLPVAFTTDGVCALAAAGFIDGVSTASVALTGAVGTCTLTANQAGDATYAPAPEVVRSFAVSAAPAVTAIAIDQGASLTVAAGTRATLTATVSTVGGAPTTVTWSSSATDVATIDADGLLTALVAGRTTITATSAFDPSHTDALELVVTSPPTTGLPLRVVLLGAGTGTVVSSPSGIDCGADCDESFATRTRVTLTAIADPGSVFVGWGGACSGTRACTVRMTQATEVTATFEALPAQRTLTVERIGSGTVKSNPPGIDCGTSCAAAFADGTEVALTASDRRRVPFLRWEGDVCDGRTALTCTFTIAADTSVIAVFGR